MDKLSEIMRWKRKEIAGRIRPVGREELAECGGIGIPRPSFSDALGKEERLSVIAEIKRRSPSAGEIATIPSAIEQAKRYSLGGADALSILTDEKYFGGSLEDLSKVTAHFKLRPPPLPCLRKDFMVHPYQVLEAAQAGASAILIIVRALNDEEIRELAAAANSAGLDVLYEIHEEGEIERALKAGARVIGINNRDLATFQNDLSLSEKLLPKIPAEIIRVSESGIFTPEDAARVRRAGADAILVGEALMKSPDPASLLSAFHNAR